MSELKQYHQVFKGQVTDFSDQFYPKDFFKNSSGLRFNTNKTVSQGSFTFEKGTSYLLSIPFITITTKNNRKFLTYIRNSENKTYNIEYQYRDKEGNISELGKLTDSKGNNVLALFQHIISVVPTDTGMILFTTDNTNVNCIWEYKLSTNELLLKYVRSMGYTSKSNITAIYNYENEIIRKVYWIDGLSQLKFINLENSIKNGDYEELIDIPFNSTNQVGDFIVSQPEVDVLPNGGYHTAGVIQYCYNLYKSNGSQTKLSPLTNLVSLGNGNVNGGNVNDRVTDLPKININRLDPNYNNIRIYSLKYTTLNTIPEIKVIYDAKITTYNNFSITDTGNQFVQNVSLEEFMFIGNNPIYPKDIETRDNRLFLANYKEDVYSLKGLDMRAFAFKPNEDTITFYKNFIIKTDVDKGDYDVQGDITSEKVTISKTSINNLNTYPGDQLVQADIDKCDTMASGGKGLEGKYIKLHMNRFIPIENGQFIKPLLDYSKILKDNELYRYAIKFYNSYGQYTEPSYIGDYYTRSNGAFFAEGNLDNTDECYIDMKVELKDAFRLYLEDNNNFLDINGKYDPKLKPVGFKILRAIRREQDKLNIVQGLVTPMVSVNISKNAYNKAVNDPERELIFKNGHKMPWLLRSTSSRSFPISGYNHKALINEGTNTYGSHGQNKEVFSSVSTSNKRTSHFQFNTMLQLISPDIIFNKVNSIDTTFFRIVGLSLLKEDSSWAAEQSTESLDYKIQAKVINRLSPGANFNVANMEDPYTNEIVGNPLSLFDYGFVGPTGGESANMVQLLRDFTLGVDKRKNNNVFNTFKKPIIVERNQGETSYNGISEFTFTNKMNRFRTDTPRDNAGTSDPKGYSAITKFNSTHCRNITFVIDGLKPIEELILEYSNSYERDACKVPIVEFFRHISYYYRDNMYGGNRGIRTMVDFTEIGHYIDIRSSININTPIRLRNIGDTFIGEHNLEKFSCDNPIVTTDAYNLIEILKFRGESSIDSNKRSDLSVYTWDSFFMPNYFDFHKYNDVYSQEDNLIKNTSNAYNYKPVSRFENRIIVSKPKYPGELIDSWTTLMLNNFIDIDGKYGPISKLLSFGHGLVTFQPKAVSIVSVSPRVQTLDTDGNSIQLGKGDILNDFKVLSNEYGSINNKAILTTLNGIYFYDKLNNTIGLFNGERILDLVKSKGFIKGFKDAINSKLVEDNSIIENKSITLNYCKFNNDVYLNLNNNKVLVFNETLEQFAGSLPYNSPILFNVGDRTFSLNPYSKDQIHEHQVGNNLFYNKEVEVSLEFLINPEPLIDVMVSNISYDIENLNNNLNNSNREIGWEAIKADNTYQDTGEVMLVDRLNYRKINRQVNIAIPRVKKSRYRLVDKWLNIKLKATLKPNTLFRNNAFIVTYKPLPKDIR